ncbi:unnamed protein product [Lactuca virosa]|uniref:Uncharacterized protein n=1 Tax=Lactuca virosa TaxID=75947 RepID=A0AAU9PXS3_9ASTR|nr:unnamed protein product [Lactuca virosa]
MIFFIIIVVKSIMSKRGGRGRRGGLGRQDGEHTTLYNTSTFATNVVIERSQTTEQQHDPIFETEQEHDTDTTSAKRGLTCGKGARKTMKATNKRLTVKFNFKTRQVVCDNVSAFMYECGYILRSNCSMQYKEWRHVPEEARLPLRHRLTTLFEIDVEDANVHKVMSSHMPRAWRTYISQLHDYFKGIGGPVDPTKAKTTPPPNMASKDD